MMPRYYYNASGNLRGVSYSDKDRANQAKGFILYIVVCILIAPFYPLYFASSAIYDFLNARIGLHALFAGSFAVGVFLLGLYGLWKSILFRYLYFGSTTVVISVIVFKSAYKSHDAVWATFFSILTLLAGLGLTYATGLIPRLGNIESNDGETPGDDRPLVAQLTHNQTVDEDIDYNNPPLSYPLNDDEVLLILGTIDERTWELLRAIAENSSEAGLAGLAWTEVQQITGSRNWSHFARGMMARLHRDLRDITGDPKAVLLVDTDKLASEEQRVDFGKMLMIHGPAVEALRRYFEMEAAG